MARVCYPNVSDFGCLMFFAVSDGFSAIYLPAAVSRKNIAIRMPSDELCAPAAFPARRNAAIPVTELLSNIA